MRQCGPMWDSRPWLSRGRLWRPPSQPGAAVPHRRRTTSQPGAAVLHPAADHVKAGGGCATPLATTSQPGAAVPHLWRPPHSRGRLCHTGGDRRRAPGQCQPRRGGCHSTQRNPPSAFYRGAKGDKLLTPHSALRIPHEVAACRWPLRAASRPRRPPPPTKAGLVQRDQIPPPITRSPSGPTPR